MPKPTLRALSLIVALTVAAHGAAWAQAEDARERQARADFAAGDYRRALETYIQLYADTHHPTYMRNIGRCYQNLGEPDKAINSFREYLRQARDLPIKQRQVVEGYIKEMEDLKRTRPQSAPPPAPPPATRAAEPPPTVMTTPPPAEPAPPSSDADPRKTAAYVVGAASAIALGAGAFFGVRAISKNSDADRLCKNGCDEAGYQANQSALSAARLANITIGAGLLGAGVATYLFLTARDETPPTRETALRLRLEPQVAPRQAGLVLQGRW